MELRTGRDAESRFSSIPGRRRFTEHTPPPAELGAADPVSH
jgi:hypothetical protein